LRLKPNRMAGIRRAHATALVGKPDVIRLASA
jgi:hypothetical protein